MKKRLFFGFILAFLLGFGIWTRLPSHTALATTRLVTIHGSGESETIATSASTVRDAMKRLEVPLGSKDKTEPSLDTQIKGPNFTINVYRARPITVVDGPNSYTIMTAERSPQAIATSAGFSINPEDQFKFQLSDDPFAGAPGTQLIIERSKTINFVLYGTTTSLNTHQNNVRDLLTERKINLDPGDELNVPLAARISDGMTISIDKINKNVQTVEEAVAFPETKIQNVNQPTTFKQVNTPGQNGKKLVTYEITSRNGKEAERKVLKEVVTLQPVAQVITVGIKPLQGDVGEDKQAVMAAVGIADSDFTYVDYIVSRESGWCATKWQGQYGGCPAYHGTPSSGGYGLCQATPPGKMSSAGADWATSAITQMKWCNGYALGRYGSWSAAYSHWLSAHSW